MLLSNVECRGTEERVTECDIGAGFLANTTECPIDASDYGARTLQLHVACRRFPVAEALEAVTTPGAGVHLHILHSASSCCRADRLSPNAKPCPTTGSRTPHMPHRNENCC